tara:strand:+ start:384 stop:836 length:453 start_codon:yes stop_codon:yes gene_type:complete
LAFTNLFLQLINKYINLISIEQISGIFIFVAILSLLIFNNTKIFIKRIILLAFFIISILIWLTTINFLELDYTYFYNQLLLSNFINNNNILNIFNLFFIELVFFLWSYLSNDNNLSNWIVLVPKKYDFYPLLSLSLIYIAAIFYYFKMVF